MSKLYQSYKENIEILLQASYPSVMKFDGAMRELIIKQLFWVQENAQFTPQAEFLYEKGKGWGQYINREIFRALNRIECMLLLQDESMREEDLYAIFTKDQDGNDQLNFDSFIALRQHFMAFSPEQFDAQIRASLIASVTLSPQAKQAAHARLGENKYPYDSVMFSGATVTQVGDMYPAYASASAAVKELLCDYFPNDNRHWRHAFFLENSSCLVKLQHEFQNCKTSDERQARKLHAQHWLNYWLINALGFNGHTKTLTGSAFMTESVYQRAMMLNNAILQLTKSPDIDVFAVYCRQCLQYLRVNLTNNKAATLIVRIANMTNVFNADFVNRLVTYLRQNQMMELIEKHYEVFKSGKVATYLPGFLQNVYHASQNESDNVRFQHLLNATSWAVSVLQNSSAAVTSFRLVDAKAVKQLIASEFSCDTSQIEANGEVKIINAMGAQLGFSS